MKEDERCIICGRAYRQDEIECDNCGRTRDDNKLHPSERFDEWNW